MSEKVIEVERLSKAYQLGQIGTGTISKDIQRFITTKILKRDDPFLKIGETNDRTVSGGSNVVWSLRDINFTVNKGEAIGIIGKNGAGKSTLLKLLSRVTTPTSGSVKIKGRVASLLEVGTGFHPELSGRENVYLNGAILGMKKAEIKKKFDEIIDFAGVDKYVDTPVKRYSSGMYVRLAFAVAAHLESEILIVDEVLAVGDAEFQKKCLGKMGDISSSDGRTILFVSHNMASVKSLCTKGIVLDKGQITAIDTSDNATNFYLASNYKLSNTDLLAREDRKGDGRIVVSDLYFKNVSEVRVNDLVLGESYKLCFEYKRYGNVNPKDVVLVVEVLDRDERIVTTFATDELGVKFSEVPSSGSIVVDIPQLRIRGGDYYVNYLISEKKSKSTPHVHIDFITNAISFKVLSTDFFNSGMIIRNTGFVLDSLVRIEGN